MGDLERRKHEGAVRRGGVVGTVARGLSYQGYWKEVLDLQNAREAEFRRAKLRLFRHLVESGIAPGVAVKLESTNFRLGKFSEKTLQYALRGRQAKIKPFIGVHVLYLELLKQEKISPCDKSCTHK